LGVLFLVYITLKYTVMSEISYFTKEGLEKLKAELHDLKTKGRAEMARQIQEARDKGDLSENAEYDAAKDAQGLLEMKIAQLENLVANSRAVDETTLDVTRVQPLLTVKLKNLINNAVLAYTLVSEKEADLKQKKISVTSPIGSGVMGKSVGDVVEIQVPAGLLKFEILEIYL
jgi:transcription elongation factor GreA